MRQIATLPDADAARTLTDYLLTLRIETRLEREPDGWALWVCDEDRVPQAREELAAFTRNPQDPRYAGAGHTAQALRQQESRADEAYRRRQAALRDRFRGPRRARPPLTFVLIALSVVVALTSRMGEDKNAPVLQALSIAPFEIHGGMIGWNRLQNIRQGQVWRLVTPIFIHFGLPHLAFNMFMLYQLGAAVEARRGSWRLLLLVLVIAVVSNVAQYYLGHVETDGGSVRFQPSPAFGGMSGVLYGLFGYAWMKARFEPALGLGMDRNTVIFLMAWFFVCLSGILGPVIGPVANMAHGAGLVVGLAIGYAPTLWRSLGGG